MKPPHSPDKRGDPTQLAAIVDASSDAIIAKSLDGTVLSWNDAAERMFGFTASEMIGQSIRRLIPDELQGEEDEIVARLSKGEVITTFETIRRHKDGRKLPLALTISPIRAPDGTIIGASKVARDISDDVMRRKAMRFAEERFRMLADNIDQLAWITDETGWIEWYNKRWYEFTGTDLEQMQGWGWEKVHHPDHIDRVKEIWTNALAKGEGWEDTFPLRSVDGEYRWFLSRAHPVRDSGGKIRYWFGTNTDITAERDHERRIRLLLGESNHRAKNMLTMIQALIHRTAHENPEFVAKLESRISALGANHDLLVRSEWSGALIKDVIISQLAYVDDIREQRISVDGPEVMLRPQAAEVIGLAIHELATNAAKYGALSNEEGRVDIGWKIIRRTGGGDRFILHWSESGGPPVGKPSSAGFGTTLISRNPEIALRAEVVQEFRTSGLCWTIDAPLDRVENNSGA